MKAIRPDDFRVSSDIHLAKIPTSFKIDDEKEDIEQALEEVRGEMAKLQDKMYAHDRYGLLVCLQGMDTSGKDSLIREVFKEIHPRGVNVFSFKQPTSLELEHDYLWRHYMALPERGKWSIFNRTHYENLLVTRVHPDYLLGEHLPQIASEDDITDDFWQDRIESINAFEKHIASNGVIVLKFFLHISKEEQRERLLKRLENEEDNWKFSVGDLKERALWEDYQKCYELAINGTSRPKAPWFVIPADHKATARYLVGKIILDELEKYQDIAYPELQDEVKNNIRTYRKQLEEES